MKNIPNIAFKGQADFDLLNLSELFGRLEAIKDHNPTLPHRISFFALLIVTKGTGKHQIDLKDYDLTEGTVLKIAQGQVHAFQKNASYEGFLVIFTNNFVLNYFPKSSVNLISHLYNYHLTSPLSINHEENTEFVKQISDEISSKDTYAQNNIIAAFLNLYLLKLERAAHNTENKNIKPKRQNTFIAFKNLVESNYTTTRNVKDYADLLFISTKSLNHIVQEFTINTAKTFIDNYVVLEAKRDLISTTKSIKEIAFSLGFDEVTNFSKVFKKHTAASPKEFKMGVKNK